MFKISYCCFCRIIILWIESLDTFLTSGWLMKRFHNRSRTVILDHNRYRRLIQSHNKGDTQFTVKLKASRNRTHPIRSCRSYDNNSARLSWKRPACKGKRSQSARRCHRSVIPVRHRLLSLIVPSEIASGQSPTIFSITYIPPWFSIQYR